MQSSHHLFWTWILGFARGLRDFAWRLALRQLRQRLAHDQIALTASSLTFTTTIALVPFITVALAVFTAFPMFGKLQAVLQQWLVESLVPENIARQVLGYLTQFAGKASRLGAVGLVALLGTALALVLTIDRTLNRIWRVRRVRPLRQRVLMYWAVLTLGPLLLAAVLASTSYVLTLSTSMVGGQAAGAGALRWAVNVLEFLLLALGMAALFKNVPNTHVKWPHAWVGGVLVSVGFELAKKGLTLYLAGVPTYNAVYGAFATVPILLVWIYLAWTIVLVAAELVALMPGLTNPSAQPAAAEPPGAVESLELALKVLQKLKLLVGDAYGQNPEKSFGMTQTELARELGVDPSRLEAVLLHLAEQDWVGRVDELDGRAQRYVLLKSP
jgi:membrane protein